MKLKLIVLSLFFTVSSFLHAQIIRSKLDVVGGLGVREFVHAGLRYQYTDITQIGIYYGGDLEFGPEIIKTYAMDHFVHFGQISFNSGRPVWYARQGITYSDEVIDSYKTVERLFFVLGAGREFTVNTWLGFNVDAGINWQLLKTTRENGAVIKDNLRQVLPMARFQMFISF